MSPITSRASCDAKNTSFQKYLHVSEVAEGSHMGQVSYLSLSAFHIVTFAFKVKWVSLLNLQGVDD